MQGEGIISIELAIGAAVFVLGARLLALVQATRGVSSAHEEILEALRADDGTVQARTRGLRYRNPYAELATVLIEASQRDTSTPSERSAVLDRAAGVSGRRLGRRTQQGQAMDIVALAVAIGILAFARGGLPAGPVFWSLSGAVILLLVSSIFARAHLKTNVQRSLTNLRTVLQTRPQMPSLSDDSIDCFWCGGKTEKRTFEVREQGTNDAVRVLGAFCSECGKLVVTLPLEDDTDSMTSSASHPLP